MGMCACLCAQSVCSYKLCFSITSIDVENSQLVQLFGTNFHAIASNGSFVTLFCFFLDTHEIDDLNCKIRCTNCQSTPFKQKFTFGL